LQLDDLAQDTDDLRDQLAQIEQFEEKGRATGIPEYDKKAV
jgi:hypothetical protein